MKSRHCLFIILLGAAIIAGCAAADHPAGPVKTSLPLNAGVKDLSFLSPMEIEILEAVNETRGAGAAEGPLAPLKTSRGLSFAARQRAQELSRPNRPAVTEEEERGRLFERVRRYGAWNGSVAEIASYGYTGAAAVTELMKKGPAIQKRPPLYFMDAKFTVMGIGCTQAGYPPPICVLTFASGFEETR